MSFYQRGQNYKAEHRVDLKSEDCYEGGYFRKNRVSRSKIALADRCIPYKDEKLTQIAQFEIENDTQALPFYQINNSRDLTFDEREEQEKKLHSIQQYDNALKQEIFNSEREISSNPYKFHLEEPSSESSVTILPRLLKYKQVAHPKHPRKYNFEA